MNKKLLVSALLFFVIMAIVFILQSFDRPKKRSYKISGAYEALNLLGLQRAYPFKDIPDQGYYTAYQYSKQALKKGLAKTSNIEPWQAMGPHNIGGRTLAIAFNPQNPNTIYAGSASGGLWRSKTGGVGTNAWEYVSTGYPVLSVSSIAFASNDSSTIYIGTGEVYNYQNVGTGAAFRPTRGFYGIGILKTTDGGATWMPSLNWAYNQRHGVWAVRVNPLNPNTVWAATTEGTFKSTDAGATWTRIHRVIMANDLVIHPVDTSIVIVACGNFRSEGHGIYRTTDAGKTWMKATQGVPQTFGGKALLTICESSPEFIYASIGNGFSVGSPENASWLCMSMDSGASWAVASEEDYSQWQGWFAHDVAVDPANFTNIIAIGIDIWKSVSCGFNLVQKTYWGAIFTGPVPPGEPEGPPYYSHADHHDVVFHPTDPNIIYFATDGGVFRSLDGGETFEGCNGGFQTTQFYNGFSCSQLDSNLAMGGLQDNGTTIFRGTTTWDKYIIGGDGSWTAIDATNDNMMYGSWQNLNMMKSINRGQSWRRINPPYAGGWVCFIAPYVIGIDNPQVIYTGQHVVHKSINGGSNWIVTNSGAPLDGNPVFAMGISHQNSNVVYAATAPAVTKPGVFRTINGGMSWDNITADLPNRFPGDIAVDPTNDSVVYVTFLGFGTSHVFKSTDHGDTWQDIGVGLPDLPTSSIVIDAKFPNNIYVGNDLGVYVSPDGGKSWQEFSEGLPDAVIAMDLAISPTNRKLRVATHGNGAYERNLLDSLTVSLAEHKFVPLEFRLEQNYPNPFNPTTKIVYSIAQPCPVTLTIYNTLGQEVKTLVNNQLQPAGRYEFIWDGTNDSGIQVAAGTYTYKLQAGEMIQTRKMSFIK